MTLNESSLSEDEKSNVDELRRRLRNDGMPKEMYDDLLLFRRFLRARSSNIDAAEKMLRNTLTHRKRYNVDNINEWIPPQALVEYFAINVLGFEKDGTPVVFANFGNLDFRGVLKCVTKHDVLKFVIKFLENLIEGMNKINAKLTTSNEKFKIIVSYEGLSLMNVTHKPIFELLMQVLSTFDLNYPERLKTVFLVKGSLPLQILWTLVKPILSGPTIQKVKFLIGDDWKNELQRNVEPDILPAFLGGNVTDPDGDPRCKTKLILGGPIPEKYYKYKTGPSLKDKEDAQNLTVSRKSKSKVKFEVFHPDSKMEWEFELENRDIDFSLVYLGQRDANTEMAEDLIPSRRVETNLKSETGMYTCKKTGIYALEFDNTYSWLHSKDIYYTVSVNEPTKQNSCDPPL